MGILDDAIREHLDLKRTHGADDSELRKIESEAFGPPVRPGDSEPGAVSDESELPDAEAEAPTEFLGASVPAEVDTPPGDESTAPEDSAPEDSAPEGEDERSGETGEFGEEAPAEPVAESAPPPPPAPSTEEREVIAEQPTQFYDFESEVSSAEESPSADDLYEERLDEPRLAPSEPIAEALTGDALTHEPAADEPFDEDPEPTGPAAPGIGPEPIDEGGITIEKPPETDEQFFDESSLSDELDRALDAPEAEEPPPSAEPPPPPEPQPVEDDEPAAPPPELSDDVLEETPEFLQDTPEDERLWFEQKPPKDFDFDE